MSGQTQSEGTHFSNWIVRNILVVKLFGFAEVFIFVTPVVLVFGKIPLTVVMGITVYRCL